MARLGYQRYGAQGSDWGTSITASLGQQDQDHVAGVHLVPPLAPPDPATFGDLTEQERGALASLGLSAAYDSGYSAEQATRPQTIGYALVDSPAALCAWIIEKFWAWTDCDGLLENVLTRDELRPGAATSPPSSSPTCSSTTSGRSSGWSGNHSRPAGSVVGRPAGNSSQRAGRLPVTSCSAGAARSTAWSKRVGAVAVSRRGMISRAAMASTAQPMM